MQSFFNAAASQNKVAYFDKGAYIVQKTITIPKDVKVVGELWSLIMARGPFFGDQLNPQPMWRVGEPGQSGTVEIVDIVFETKGPAPGAILVEWNIKQAYPGGAGMWDSHYRIGGTYGTDILVGNCRKSPGVRITKDSDTVKNCYGAFMLLHVTPQANIYMENVWGWVSDHQLDGADRDQIYVFNGRYVSCHLHRSNTPLI
jgi:glucan 1,3-beta-glucosidase